MGMESGFSTEQWELIAQHRDELVRQATAILGSHGDAEDVVQETFCKAFKEQAHLTHPESLDAWLSTINRRNALNRLRARRREQHKLSRKLREAPERSVTTGGFSGIELREIMSKAVEGLPPSLRAVVVLRYFEHLSYQEIAQKLRIPEGTVGYLLCQAFMQLFDKLQVSRLGKPAKPHPAAASGLESGDKK